MKAVELEDIVRTSLEKKLIELNSSCEKGSHAASDTLGTAKPVVLAAVSGGVDSMVMLRLLKTLAGPLSYELRAITVNHNIRSEAESAGDAALVEDFCRKLNVPCTVTELQKNEVAEAALERGGGTEEAARFLRYRAFDTAADACGAAVICVAHNRNDRLETLIGRFFQGAAGDSASGMKQSRDRIFRPLFDISRKDIEAYAACKCIPFRTDATNADNRYYRNRIRNELMPLLNTLIPGWDTAVLHGAAKNALIAAALGKHASAVVWEPCADKACAADKADTCAVSADEAAFKALEPAERIEALYRGLYLLETDRRVPYEMLRTFAVDMMEASDTIKAEGAGVSIECKSGRIIMKKLDEAGIDGFCCLIKDIGRYTLPWGDILIHESKERVGKNAFYAENIKNGAISGVFPLPVLIRSRQPSDRIRDKDGGHKEVSKLFSEWHILRQYENELPVFENGEVIGVWGGVFNYPDYFVKPLEGHQ